MKKYFAVLLFTLVIFGCKTDFEINAPYDKIPIIYGVLDQSVDTQWIKINKSFLGENNLNYPAVNDSMYFDSVEVKIEELNESGVVTNVFSLQSKYVSVSDGAGIFFTDKQKVYYFVPPAPLQSNKSYRITGNGDGRPFSATTNIVDEFNFTTLFRGSLIRDVKLANNIGIYNEVRPSWNQSPDAEFYDVSLRFHYKEHRNGKVLDKFIDWKIGERKPTNFGELSLESNAESFFILLSNSKELQDTVGVTKRVIGNVDYRVTSSNFILKTYIDVNKPNSAISFDKPDYTNIEGGRGVFASKFTVAAANKTLSEKTIEELFTGPYTQHFKFCTGNTFYNSEPFYCP